MVRWICRGVLAAVLAHGVAAARADESGEAIDLDAFGQAIDEGASVSDDLPLHEMARRGGSAQRRFYLSGMIGPSFASVASPTNPELASDGTIFNAGSAFGIAFARRRGQLRLEAEAMGRTTYDAPFSITPSPDDGTVLINNWSLMQNAWRDLMLTDRFGIYGGGGIGVGGYTFGERFVEDIAYTTPDATYAWQAGGGLVWLVNDRLTFDVGYRYFHLDTMKQETLVQANQFAASELMFTLRLYEPFRAWRR